MERWWVRVQERGEIEYSRQVGWGESGLVFLLCCSERGPACVYIDGSVFRRFPVLPPGFLVFFARTVVERGDHLSTNTTTQVLADRVHHPPSRPGRQIYTLALFMVLPVVVLDARNFRHVSVASPLAKSRRIPCS